MEPSKALTAAEKRAARRARVLGGGDRRLQLVTGQVSSLKTPTKDEEQIDQALDDGVNELLSTSEKCESLSDNVTKLNDNTLKQELTTPNISFPSRIDPVQRRRDAAARRQRKEAIVQQLLGNTPTESAKGDTEQGEQVVASDNASSTSTPVHEPSMKKSSNAGWSRHSLALRLHSIQEKLIILILVGTAIYSACKMDLRNLTSDFMLSDPLFQNYQQLVSQGVSFDVIRQQMQREQVSPSLMYQVEKLFTTERMRVEEVPRTTSWSTGASQWIPNVLDWPQVWLSFLSHPPILFYVIALRIFISFVARMVHSILNLPDVNSSHEEDLGMVLNLVLSSRPALKGYIIQSRKAVDELFVFLWCYILVVASRVVIEYHS